MTDSKVMKSNEHRQQRVKVFRNYLGMYLPLFMAFLFAALSLWIGFTKKPLLYPVDYGQYERILKDVGLTWTAEDLARGNLQFDRPITTFDYVHFSWSHLFTPSAGGSLVYPAAILRLFTEPFGQKFSVDGLAVVYACLLFISFVLLTVGLRHIFPRCWFVPVIVLCLVFENGNFCSIFRGLYPEGAAILFTLMFAGVSCYVWSIKQKKQGYYVLLVVMTSFLMVKASTPLIVFLPFVIITDLVFIVRSIKMSEGSYLLPAAALLILITGTVSSVELAGSDLDYFSNASVYESVFNTLMPAADDPDILAIEFGLDKSYLEDVGKSYYLDGNSYAHDPRNPEEAEALFSKVKTTDVVWIYLLHPDLFASVIRNIPVSYERFFENPRNREKIENSSALSRSDGGIFSIVWQFLPHSYRLFSALACIFSVCFLVLSFSMKKKSLFLISLFMLSSIAYLPFCVMLNGYNISQQYVLYHTFLELILVIVFLFGLTALIPYAEFWISKYMDHPFALSQPEVMPVSISGLLNRFVSRFMKVLRFLCGDRWKVTLFTFILGGAMLLFVCLPADHPVSVNNGDYGRVIDHLDIMWSGDVYFDVAAQMGHKAIEEYNYVKPFDPLKLTPLKPTYTVYWFASVVRLLTEPFGRPFSTLILAWVMEIVSLICVLKIVWDLYPFLKKWTLAAAVVLCLLLFSETTLAWYNSLFGEGTIVLGLLMSLMCALHLCLIPQRGKGRILWLAGLTFSLYIMVGAKSQMLVTVPGAVILLAALAYYHRPYRYDLMTVYFLVVLCLCIVLAYSGFGVYRSERSGDSVSQKSNMWHAYFYGIFMISDDPIADMKELGVDTAMAPDIGKFVQFEDDSQYVYAPLSPEADAAFHQHVSLMTIIKWYLTHPDKLWFMLDYAARITRRLYTDFRVYNGQDYSDPAHDPVDGMNLWPGWRECWTPSAFIGYVLLYGVIFYLNIRTLLSKKFSAEKKILCAIPLFLLITASIQFPISVLGNGFGDNQKQMFGFELSHDLLMTGVLVLGARYLFHFSTHFSIPSKMKNWLGNLKSGIHAGVKDN